jgi:hypothetical protein
VFSPVTISVTETHRRGNLGAGKERRERERERGKSGRKKDG